MVTLTLGAALFTFLCLLLFLKVSKSVNRAAVAIGWGSVTFGTHGVVGVGV